MRDLYKCHRSQQGAPGCGFCMVGVTEKGLFAMEHVCTQSIFLCTKGMHREEKREGAEDGWMEGCTVTLGPFDLCLYPMVAVPWDLSVSELGLSIQWRLYQETCACVQCGLYPGCPIGAAPVYNGGCRESHHWVSLCPFATL